MSKREFTLFLMDVIVSLEKIQRLVEPFEDAEKLLHSELHYLAVLKLFEIVGEAMRYLIDEPVLLAAQNPAWRGAIGLRNLIVHEYFVLDHQELFTISKNGVPKLLKDFEKLCLEIKDNPKIKPAMEDTRADLIKNWQKESAEYIQKLITKCYGK